MIPTMNALLQVRVALGVLALGFIPLLIAGCKAPPAKTTGFFGETDGLQAVPEIEAVHQMWAKPGVDWNKFKKIQIAPVNTKFLRERTVWQKMSFAEFDEKGVQNMADFVRQTFVAAQRNNRGRYRLEVVNQPDRETVVLEMAITELVPTKNWLNLVTITAVMYSFDKGVIAIEGRLRDGPDGEIIGKFTDREAGKDNILNIKDFSLSAHARAIIEEWAQQSVKITNAEEGETVRDSSAFEWKVW